MQHMQLPLENTYCNKHGGSKSCWEIPLRTKRGLDGTKEANSFLFVVAVPQYPFHPRARRSTPMSVLMMSRRNAFQTLLVLCIEGTSK
jgi:hypothetical protein